MDENLSLTNPACNSDLAIAEIKYDPSGQPNSQRAIEEALINNLLVVYPAEDELQIDIDNEHSYLVYVKQMDIMKKYLGAIETKVEASRSGLPKRHITVKLNHSVTMLERIALQACLGSDRVRELLSLVQYQNGDPHPVLFLEKGQDALPASPMPVALLGGISNERT